jgi:hypothetical protein
MLLLQTEPPEVFDDNLPHVTVEDIKLLQKALPELEEFLRYLYIEIPISSIIRQSGQRCNYGI